MTQEEHRVYELELRIIGEHFKGLRPRPVKLVYDTDFDGNALEPDLLINARLLAEPNELARTLKHELIHYELKDSGKDYHGHGSAFLKRSRALGIVGGYELERCLSMEEYEVTPTRRKITRLPLAEFKVKRIAPSLQALLKLARSLPREIEASPFIPNLLSSVESYCRAVEGGEAEVAEIAAGGEAHRMSRAEFKEKRVDAPFTALLAIAERLPDKLKVKLYRLAQGLQASVGCYCHALEQGDDCVVEEFLTKKPGRKAKSLLEWKDEYDRLKAEQKALLEAAGETCPPRDLKVREH